MKKSVVMIIAVVLCIIVLQGAFASDPNEYRQLEVKEGYSLEEVLWFRPTTYSVDVLQFLQAYLNPSNPKEFFVEAAGYTDEQIDEAYVIYQSFLVPELAGFIQYWIMCDYEAYYESLGMSITDDNDPTALYAIDLPLEQAETVADIIPMFPRGIGRTNAYDSFRRAAIALAVYADRNGKTPSFDFCLEYIQAVLNYYEQLFNQAMESEAALGGEVVESN